MTAFRFQAEVRLIRWGESSSAGRTITLELPPDAGDAHPFRGLPTGHNHGQRFRMQFDAIADDEQIPPAGPHHQQEGDATAVGPPEVVSKRQTSTPPAGGSHKERYRNGTPAQQAIARAAILAGTQRFHAWASDGAGVVINTVKDAAEYIRYECGVMSKREFETNSEALRKFLALETSYLVDTEQMARPR